MVLPLRRLRRPHQRRASSPTTCAVRCRGCPASAGASGPWSSPAAPQGEYESVSTAPRPGDGAGRARSHPGARRASSSTASSSRSKRPARACAASRAASAEPEPGRPLVRPARPDDADEVARLAELMYRSLGLQPRRGGVGDGGARRPCSGGAGAPRPRPHGGRGRGPRRAGPPGGVRGRGDLAAPSRARPATPGWATSSGCRPSPASAAAASAGPCCGPCSGGSSPRASTTSSCTPRPTGERSTGPRGSGRGAPALALRRRPWDPAPAPVSPSVEPGRLFGDAAGPQARGPPRRRRGPGGRPPGLDRARPARGRAGATLAWAREPRW